MLRLRRFVAEKTWRFRMELIRLLSPSVYKRLEGLPRPMIHYLRRRFGGKPLVGVEIGVGYGRNAKSILKTLNMKMLYLIDPYIPYIVDGKGVVTRWIKGLEVVRKELEPLPNVTFIHATSEEAVDYIPNQLDFVYIDGNHSYEYVKKDIELYYPKVKSGGVIGGHDFRFKFKGVIKAVVEFSQKNNLEFDGKYPDWWIIKP